MKRVLEGFLLLALAVVPGWALRAAERPVDLVYPLLDTYNSRWFFFSSAARPFGMVSLSPDTKVNGAWSSGYVYTTENIKGFSHIHAWQMSGLSVMPVSYKTGQERSLFKDYSSDFSHGKETVEVGYHSVYLDRYDVRAELTSTVRTGFHRYSFERKGEKHGILFNLNGELGPCDTYDGELVLLDDHTVAGHFKDAPTFRRPKPVSIHFRAELDAPVAGVVRDAETGNCLLVLAPGCDEVKMKVGISYTSEENAALNLREENPGWDFDAVVRDCKDEWNGMLSRIEIEGGSLDGRRRFYTDLWHALIGRHIINDVDGAYPDNMGEEYRTGHLPVGDDGRPLFNHFNTDGLWGVQWNLNILWGLVYPDIYRQFIGSQMQYCHDGGLIPRGPSGGNYTYVMTSSSSTPFFVSAVQKGIVTEDLEEIYQALKKNHMPGGIMERGRYEHKSALGGGLKYYLEGGYVPYPIPDERVGHTDGAGLTLEYAYQDWCLAQLARKLGHKEDYKYFMKRGQNYRNVFDADSGWMRPKDIDGKWLEPFDPFETGCGFIEANAAQDTWYVPHDAKGLAKLLGGKKKAVEKLEWCFKEAEKLNFTSGTSHEAENNPEYRRIPVNYGNEPSIQTAFMFNLFGRHDLSEYWSRQVVDKVFTRLAPDAGYNGDEDQGLMGGLSVMMKLGLFQVNGGTDRDPVYQTGSPVFDRVVIHLDKDFYPGDSITISAENASSGSAEVRKLYLNGRPLKAGRLRHSDLVGGADLRFVFAEPKNEETSAGEKVVGERIRVATEGLANPERGFRFEIRIGEEKTPETETFTVDCWNKNGWPFPDYRDDGIVMAQAYCYLDDYIDCDIPQSRLDALQASFDRARKDGVKFVLRFAYEMVMDDSHPCPTLERILSHMEQLTPIVRKNIDVIYTLQTGWVGSWGEFHHNPRGLDQDPEAVAAVLGATLKMLPESRSTMMRCMRYRTLAEEGAGPGVLDMKRVGFFNDGTLAGFSDGGTFLEGSHDGDPEFAQLLEESYDIPVEGELFWNSVPEFQSANALNALHRFIDHRYTTFSVVHSNSELDFLPIPGTIDAWKATPFTAALLKAQGVPCDENYFKRNPMPSAYEYFRDHFGYRLEVVNSEGTFSGKSFSGEVTLRNVGFARPINPRQVWLVLFDRKGNAFEYPLDIDARAFQPWEEISIPLEAVLPSDAPKGKYRAALWLPDEADSIKYRPEYAITIAEGVKTSVLGGRLLNILF